MKTQSDTLMCRVRMNRVLGLRRILVIVETMMSLSLAFVPMAHAQHNTTNSDRVRDSLLALPSYRREHLQTHPAIYERYNRPGLCLQALWRSRGFYIRDKRPDTIFTSMFERGTPPIVQQIGSTCISKFDVGQLPKDQLLPLMTIYLSLNQPRLMDSVYSRLIREYPTRDTADIRLKATKLMRLRQHFLGGPLSDWTWIYRIAADVDSLGPSAAQFSVIVNDAGEWARAKLDPDAAIVGSQKSIAAFKKMPTSEMMDWGGMVNGRYEDWAVFQFWKDGRPEGVGEFLDNKFIPELASFSAGNPEAIATLRRMTERWRYPFTFYGKPAPAAPAKHWFYPNAADTGKLSWEGQPTLVMFVRPNCGGGCYAQYSLAKLFHEKFGARGLRILFITSTDGYFRRQVPETPAEEVELIRKYYHEFLKMPVILAIDESRFNRLIDGRRVPEDVPWMRRWPIQKDVLIGRDGLVKSLISLPKDGLPWMLAEIEKVL